MASSRRRDIAREADQDPRGIEMPRSRCWWWWRSRQSSSMSGSASASCAGPGSS